MNDPQELTIEALRVRISAAGITVAEHRLTLVQRLLNDALATELARGRRERRLAAGRDPQPTTQPPSATKETVP